MVVTELKEKYPHIRRIAYLCKHESGCLVGAGTSLKQKIKDLTGRETYVPEYEGIKKSNRINSAGRASYVERNYWMVDESDFSIIYLLEGSKNLKRNGGTRIIYHYLHKENRGKIINLAVVES